MAIKPIGKDKNNLILWEFRCDCGTICQKPGARVQSGRIQSCGCLSKELIRQRNIANSTIKINNHYGLLTVVEHIGYRDDGRGQNEAWYLCKCSCGNSKEVCGNSLQSGFTISCGCAASYGEAQIKKVFDEYKIDYIQQKTFNDLRNDKTNAMLRFDFAVYEENKLHCLIEYDGKQHKIGPQGKWTHGTTLEEIRRRDAMKNEYCIKHNIPLYRIPANDIKIFSLNTIFNKKFLINSASSNI